MNKHIIQITLFLFFTICYGAHQEKEHHHHNNNNNNIIDNGNGHNCTNQITKLLKENKKLKKEIAKLLDKYNTNQKTKAFSKKNVLGIQKNYKQCGGKNLKINFDDAVLECEMGSICQRQNEWYWQCVPNANNDE